MAEIGDAIKQLREALGGISQEKLARRLGVTTRTTARWEAAETLSAAVLSRLRSLALSVGAYGVADLFKEILHADLDWQEGDDFNIVPGPGTADEHQLVEEFLKRYRSEDPKIQPFIDQLWAWMAEADEETERLLKRAKALAKPSLKDIVKNFRLPEKEDK